MKIVVVSAINIFEAGPLVIVRQFLASLCASPLFRDGQFKIIVFCHSAKLYEDLRHERIEFIEKPLSRKNWLFRILYEYSYFYRWSRRRNIDTWISLHDVTPNVKARRRMVYCHNTAPFYQAGADWTYKPRFDLLGKVIKDGRDNLDPHGPLAFEFFRMFYQHFYRFNIKKNDYIIVQQQWMRDAFVKKFGCDPARVIVAKPNLEQPQFPDLPVINKSTTPREYPVTTLVYPAFPRFFKNFEVLLEAMRQLEDTDVKLILTTAGTESVYARTIVEKYRNLKNVEFTGFLPHEKIFEVYAAADAMVFPSKLESWGLPLSEFRNFNKPIFAADLPYAKETLSGYPQACFFDPDDASALASLLRRFILRRDFQPQPAHVTYNPPYADNWQELLQLCNLA